MWVVAHKKMGRCGRGEQKASLQASQAADVHAASCKAGTTTLVASTQPRVSNNPIWQVVGVVAAIADNHLRCRVHQARGMLPVRKCSAPAGCLAARQQVACRFACPPAGRPRCAPPPAHQPAHQPAASPRSSLTTAWLIASSGQFSAVYTPAQGGELTGHQ